MRFYKSETSFFILIVFLGGVGIMLYRVQTALGMLTPLSMGPDIAMLVDYVAQANGFALLFLAAALLSGIFLIYPLIRIQAQDHGKLQQMTQILSARSETLAQAALTDGLTGMQNRRYFDEALKEYLVQFGRIDKPVGLMILDLDHFKSVNDTYGHDMGDAVLREVAHCLKDYTRYHDVVARLGGEEFAIVVSNMEKEYLAKLAERIRKAVSEIALTVDDVPIKVTTSIGVAEWDRQESWQDFYRRADQLLYQAKNMGRNRVCT
ncbi:GGDEF domain-containing protein [Phyllobacterium leguminum]|uniref:diguanylate cyclase n=1 Tax=Phyllobacterium leguminum TaxID=314237 RepID=A0A318T551_9HYPH|nr:GGDEF domain-containing protein [Phyllobacterium leguminum]PYE90109.1 diguanylate cyclase (GGDEF)-like protein [Phyllobacterium leguminum]